jgi:ABC-type iron transport system FetAB ATPase subunit
VLERDVAALPAGLDTVIGSRGARLSGGQAQRTAAARMFVVAPELVVVDDLSSALDAETERVLWERLAGRPDVTCLAGRTAARRWVAGGPDRRWRTARWRASGRWTSRWQAVERRGGWGSGGSAPPG